MTSSIKKYALQEQGAIDTQRKYHKNIFTQFLHRVKKRFDQIATSFWRVNYNLGMSRQEHAALGHLWCQIGCCLSLIVFRMIKGAA